jgi:predicted transcriptional regulator
MENPISIRVPKELLAELDIISEAERRSRSFLILEAVREKYGARTAAGIERVDQEIAAKKSRKNQSDDLVETVTAVTIEKGVAKVARTEMLPRKKIADNSAGVVGENPACAPMGKPDKPDMDVLRAICAGNIPPNTIPVTHDGSDHFYAENFSNFEGWDKLKPVDVDLCWHKEYNPDTGQTGACGRPKGHKGNCGAWEVVE